MFKKIQSKITLTYILFALIVIIVFGFIIDLQYKSLSKATTREDLLKEIDLMKYLLSEVKDKPIETLDTELKQIAQANHFRITLIDKDGKVILDSDVDFSKIGEVGNHSLRPEILKAKKSDFGDDIRLSRTTNKEYFYVAKKVTLTTQVEYLRNVEFIRISLSLEKFRELTSSIRWQIVYSGLIVLILVFVVGRILSKQISKPILQIIQDLKEIREGNFKKRIEVKSRDEIKLLADSINQLVEKINLDLVEIDKLVKVRSEFLANVSHELRTPIFSIQAFLETLIDGAVDDPKVNRDYLLKAKSQTDRLSNLLNDLIDISRIESGELKLSQRYFNLNDLLQSIVENFRLFAKQKQVQLELRLSSNGRVEVFGDKERLTNAINNLIDNAIRYNPPQTIVKIYYEISDSDVKVVVEDNGIGIGEEHLPRIFERFYRIDKERSRELGGTGLGLAIVKHIIEAHGSKIEVASSLGKGTKFSFTLKK
ncbi:MAG: ATP-binding protein [Ignavibacteria bacterium]|nr:ATP-binding protein [Ignavibacteria bacterium]